MMARQVLVPRLLSSPKFVFVRGGMPRRNMSGDTTVVVGRCTSSLRRQQPHPCWTEVGGQEQGPFKKPAETGLLCRKAILRVRSSECTTTTANGIVTRAFASSASVAGMSSSAPSLPSMLDAFLTPNPWDLEASAVWLPPLTTEFNHNYAGAALSPPSPTYLRPLDIASRHLIQMMRDWHLYNRPLSGDVATIERCLAILNGLRIDAPSSCVGRPERAKAILDAMEAFRHWDCGGGGRPYYQLPVPTSDIYIAVLRLYASCDNHDNVPHWALKVVEKMHDLYQHEGQIELKPNPIHWNSVLLAWSHAKRWDRAIELGKVMLECAQPPYSVLWDASAYVIAWKTCGKRAGTSERERQVGAIVAAKIWQGTIEKKIDSVNTSVNDNDNDDPQWKDSDDGGASTTLTGARMTPPPTTSNENVDLTSHAYAHFLQAIRDLPPGKARDKYFRAGLERAIAHGKLNAIIVQEVIIHNTEKGLYDQYIRPYYQTEWRKLKPSDAARQVLKFMPREWHRRADLPNHERRR